MTKRVETILVTGGCGYLGSQLLRDIATDERLPDVTIRVLDNMQSGHYRALMDLPDSGRFEFIEGDIIEPGVLRYALNGVDMVVHLAAIVKTPMSFENPAWLEQVNHWGTAHLVEACLQNKVDRFVNASTTAVYGPGGPFSENDICRPQGAYAQSKFRAEQRVSGGIERGLSAVTLRFGTLYGPAPVTRFDAVANRFAYLAGVRRTLTVYGDGRQRRPLTHVCDASDAIRLLLTDFSRVKEEVFNVVGTTASVLDLVSTLKTIIPDVTVRYTEQDIRTHFSFEVVSEREDSLGWRCQHSLTEGLRDVAAAFRGFVPFTPTGTRTLGDQS